MPYDIPADADRYARAAYALAAHLDRWPYEIAQTLGMTCRFVVEVPEFADIVAFAVSLPDGSPVNAVHVATMTLRDLIDRDDLDIGGPDDRPWLPSDADVDAALAALGGLLEPATGIEAADVPSGIAPAPWRLFSRVLAATVGLDVVELRAVVAEHVGSVEAAARLLMNGRSLRRRGELRFPPT